MSANILSSVYFSVFLIQAPLHNNFIKRTTVLRDLFTFFNALEHLHVLFSSKSHLQTRGSWKNMKMYMMEFFEEYFFTWMSFSDVEKQFMVKEKKMRDWSGKMAFFILESSGGKITLENYSAWEMKILMWKNSSGFCESELKNVIQ
jgi:hypothetical protein